MKKSNFLRCALIFLFALALNGCVSMSSSPTPKFYMPVSLEKGQAVQKIDITPGVIIAVGPVGIPEYLDRPQIVTKNNNGTLHFAQFERWGEPLDSALNRMLIDNLAVMLPSANFQFFPCSFTIPLDYHVIADVVRLDSELNKDMVLDIQWSIIDSRSKKMILTKRSEIREAIDPHNYFGVSKALSAVCVTLSRQIAESLSSISNQSKVTKN